MRGGARKGAGRKARPTSKATPIWCGQISKEDKAFIVKYLSPEERYQVLMAAANKCVQADTKACEQTFHQLMKLQGKNFCSNCGVRL